MLLCINTLENHNISVKIHDLHRKTCTVDSSMLTQVSGKHNPSLVASPVKYMNGFSWDWLLQWNIQNRGVNIAQVRTKGGIECSI